jgi:hypothetical protein
MVVRINPAATAPFAHTGFVLFIVFFIFIGISLFSCMWSGSEIRLYSERRKAGKDFAE